MGTRGTAVGCEMQVVKDAESTVVPGLLAAGEALCQPSSPVSKMEGVLFVSLYQPKEGAPFFSKLLSHQLAPTWSYSFIRVGCPIYTKLVGVSGAAQVEQQGVSFTYGWVVEVPH